MLSRDVCRKCSHAIHLYTWPSQWFCGQLGQDNGYTYCWVTKESSPPNMCGKKFEHAVAARMENNCAE
jgi:hypothetical protein